MTEKQKKCLITGGAGFIGSHLVEECILRGWKVIVLDNLSTGKKENLPVKNNHFTFIQGDITNQELLGIVRQENPDLEYVFHLAAVVSVTQSMENPVYTHKVNFDATLQLLETFRDSDLKKFVFASSSAVYGDTKKIPVDENMLPCPISPYGADKLQSEYYANIFSSSFNLPAVSCRFFNVFGERQDPSSPYSGVISIFFDKLLACKNGQDTSLAIYGDGQQTRDFIYVKDIVGALIFLAENSEISGEVFNLGYGRQTTIVSLAEKINKFFDVDIKINFRKEREGDIRHSLADIEKILNTGFEFRYDFDKGMIRLAEYLNP